MRTVYSFSVPKNVFFGLNEAEKITDVLALAGEEVRKGRVLVLTDKGIGASGIPAGLASRLETGGYRVELLDTVPQEPYSEDVEGLAASLGSRDIRAIVGIGGGSVLDTAKLLSVLLKRGGTVATLLDSGVPGPGFPCVMIPTTAGTGSESTPNAIVALRAKKLKVGIVSPYFMPDFVILDPLMTKTLPPSLTASTGVDALCHVLECYTSNKANSFSDMVALEGIRLIDGSILRAFTDGGDLEARADMLLGAFYGGMAIAASGTTAVHALSYPLGGTYRIPHGVANAILLEPIMRFNRDSIEKKLARVAAVTGTADGGDEARAADAYLARLGGLIRDLKIPASLSRLGINPQSLPELTESAFQVRRLLDNNPREMTREDILSVYQEIL